MFTALKSKRPEDQFEVKIDQGTMGSEGLEFPSKSPNVADTAVDEESLHFKGETAAIEQETHDNPEIAALPLSVRQLINLTDDPNLPTITFRYFVLSIIFVIPGAFLSQMSYFRTTKAPYSIFFVQIACHYAGHFMARVFPDWKIGLPGTRFSFSLNPPHGASRSMSWSH